MLRTAWLDRALLLALFLSLVLLLGACLGPTQESAAELSEVTGTTEARELPFETIDRSDYAAYTGEFWDVEAPGIAIVLAPSDIEQLDDFITPGSQEKLRALDYGTSFALVAFLDVQGCSQREWGIEQVLRRENELEIYASYPQPDYEKGQGCALGIYTPYHIIRLPREGLWGEVGRFTLYLNGEHAVTGSYPPVVSQATPAPTPTQESTPAQTPWPTETASPP